MTRLTTLFWAAAAYTALGLASGLYYRELTKANEFTGFTQTSVMHTHLLVLGMLVFLVMMALERIFTLSRSRGFTVFFWLYNAGLVITVAMMGVHGTRTVLGLESGPALAGVSGLGHMLLTAALVALFVALQRTVIAPKGHARTAGPGNVPGATRQQTSPR